MSAEHLSSDDLAFIEEISARFPENRIVDNFKDFLSLPPSFRPMTATYNSNYVLRRGWQRIGVSPRYVQRLNDHVETLDRMTALLPPEINKERCRHILRVHDMAEVITGDFTPHDDISKEDKSRLESLAIRIIFESRPEDIKAWEEYEGGETPEAQAAKDLDKLEIAFNSERLEILMPQLTNDLRQFRVNVKELLLTDWGIRIFNHLEETREKNRKLSKESRIVMAARSIGGPPAPL